MKSVYVSGSFKFTQEMERLESGLRKERIDYRMSKKRDSDGILGCLRRIDDADVVHIVNPEGYVGRSVCIDIGYAYAKNKPTYVMHKVDDASVMELITGVLSPKALIDFLKETSHLSGN
jgi:hypothetical protein